MKLWIIRAATAEDSSSIANFIQPIVKQFISHEFTQQGEKIMLDSMVAEAIERNILGDYAYWIAHDPESNDILGVLGVKGKNHVFHLFTQPNLHRNGVGRSLWHEYLSGSEETQFTVNSSTIAVAFYEKLGFEKQGKRFEKNGVICYPMTFNRRPNDKLV